MNPEPFTFAELVLMVDGRRRDEWDRWSSWMALYANSKLPKDAQPYPPARFNPTIDTGEIRKKFGKTESVKKIAELFGARKG